MSTDLILYSTRERVAYITFNRPPANAYNLDFMKAFGAAIDKADKDPNVGAVIINSNSEKFFCAGADIKEFQANDTSENQVMVEQARANTAAIEASGKIFIAQISGHALGGGMEIIMACDVRYAAQGSYKLGLPEIKLGLIPGNGGTQRLVRLVGVSRALELLATGDAFNIEQATQWGIINQLVEKETLDEHCFNYASTVANGPALAVAATKAAIRGGIELDLAEGLRLEDELCTPLYDSHDADEGFKAFLEKRPPEFKGK